jgi:hypothetical protein
MYVKKRVEVGEGGTDDPTIKEGEYTITIYV